MNFLSEIFGEPLQLVATLAIVLLFVFALVGINAKNKTFSAIAAHAPNLLTSFGIFFTFLGIFIALINFDIANIRIAIPQLLDGLKLAFLSSVIGLFFAIVFRVTQPSLNKSDSYEDTTASDLLGELKALNSNTIQVKEALAGDGVSSLSTQFGKLRNDFRDFAQKVSEDGSKALIEALEEVIKDFNQKISEQFGENFKELNNAVGGLLAWQQEYKEQISQLTEAFQEARKGIEIIRENIENIAQSTQQIPSQMGSLQTAFNATENRMKLLYEGLHSLSEMRQQATDAVPFLQRQINDMTTGLQKSIGQQSASIDKELEKMKSAQSNSQELMDQSLRKLDEGMQTQLQRSLDKMGNNLVSITDEFVRTYERSAEDILNLTKRMSRGVDRG